MASSNWRFWSIKNAVIFWEDDIEFTVDWAGIAADKYHGFLNDPGIPRPLNNRIKLNDLFLRLDDPVSKGPLAGGIRHVR